MPRRPTGMAGRSTNERKLAVWPIKRARNIPKAMPRGKPKINSSNSSIVVSPKMPRMLIPRLTREAVSRRCQRAMMAEVRTRKYKRKPNAGRVKLSRSVVSTVSRATNLSREPRGDALTRTSGTYLEMITSPRSNPWM